MGNCQAIDAAALVIQHPCGRLERMYWSVSASQIMKINPGHYVSLIIPLPQPQQEQDHNTVRFTRVKLLRPTDPLLLGHAYRLLTSQEVMKVLRAKKNAKLKKSQQPETSEQLDNTAQEASNQETKPERHRTRMAQTNSVAARSKSWRPSLQSISEVVS